MRYIKCPCGKTDGNDDVVIKRELVFQEYNASAVVIREVRRCDSCLKEYSVLLHYNFSYEEPELPGSY